MINHDKRDDKRDDKRSNQNERGNHLIPNEHLNLQNNILAT